MTMPALGPTDRPDQPSPAYLTMRARWQMVRDVRAGTATLRANKASYLPRYEAEEPLDWDTRVAMTFAYDAVDQTLGAMVGLAFMVEPELQDDVPPEILADWENLDGEGTHGTVFAQQCLDSALQDGHCLILAEYPPVAGTITLADQRAQDLRAYLVRITIDQVLSWRVGIRGGRRLLMQLVVRHLPERPDGAFGTKEVKEYRVFRQQFTAEGTPFVEWELWVEQGNAVVRLGEPQVVRGPEVIPVSVVFGGQRTGFLESIPPLLGLAYSNIDHTQVKSDRRYSMHQCAVPMPVFIGREKAAAGQDKVVLSSSRGIDIQLGGDAKILEPAGTALEALRTELQDIERRMAEQGLAMVLPQEGASKTATEVQFTRTRQESKLARAVRSLQDALEQSSQFMADYYGVEDGGSIVLRRDFTALTLTDADTAALTAARERGDLTLETFLQFLRLRGGLFEKLDPVAEAEAVRREMGDEDMGLTVAAAGTGLTAGTAA